ncbi:methyltransferase domain-containing protein [Enterococcus malodoratus]|uniref:methyltransferase domain-containing protein n=1 Tax=Enterococcus TaxID=1350 RepID=UPI0022E3F640|nr:methyltransferase domain-containing protein [Enterococcus malodoratus]
MAKVLDACCGSRMFWFDKNNPITTYMDKRQYYEELDTGHIINVDPDVLADFTEMPFSDNEFDLVVFDPPHMVNAGENSWLAKKYGKLDGNWPKMIHDGFNECMRVLKPNGTLVFKWNTDQISFREVLSYIDHKPLFGDKRSKTRWTVFLKEGS